MDAILIVPSSRRGAGKGEKMRHQPGLSRVTTKLNLKYLRKRLRDGLINGTSVASFGTERERKRERGERDYERSCAPLCLLLIYS